MSSFETAGRCVCARRSPGRRRAARVLRPALEREPVSPVPRVSDADARPSAIRRTRLGRRGALIGALVGRRDRIVAFASYVRLRDPRVRRSHSPSPTTPGPRDRDAPARAARRVARREPGIERFVAEVLPDNAAMLRVFADAGFAVSRRLEGGRPRCGFEIAPTETYRAAVENVTTSPSSPRSARSSLRARSRSSARRRAAARSAASCSGTSSPAGFDGRRLSGQPQAPSRSRACRRIRSIAEIPDVVDLAVICVPGDACLPRRRRRCARGPERSA